jgi:DNA ligase-1
MTLMDLVAVSERVAATAGRNDKANQLADVLRRIDRSEIPFVVAALSGRTRQGRIGIGYAAIRAALDLAKRPDALGAEPLTLLDVDRAFDELAIVKGRGSAQARVHILTDLFSRAGDAERSFIVDVLLGNVRQGALGGVMEDAVARASGVPVDRIRRAAMFAGDLDPIAVAVLSDGERALAPFQLALFRPVRPMLAQPAESIAEALQRNDTTAFETKVDGARIQVHLAGDRVAIYSRQLNDVTTALPEVVSAIRELPIDAAIFDGEVIALDAAGVPLPFQATMRRFGRRLDVDALRSELPLSTVLFDVLHLDGVDLIDRADRDRRAALELVAPHLVVSRVVTNDADQAQTFYDEVLARGHEGLMAKSLDAPYAAGARGAAWLKIKAAHTLDLVVLAVERGSGRRSKWLSNIHLGARDPASGEFVMLGKTFKGMTDEILEWQTRTFEALAIRRDDYAVYVRPEIVVEIAFNDVQQSPRYPGGFALRLARVVRYRPDKKASEADTIERVREIFGGATRKRGSDRGLRGRPRQRET